MQITKVETGTAKNGNPLKKVYLSEKINGKDMLFIFADHTRFEEVQAGMELGPDEVVTDGQYIKLVNPDGGIKGKGGGSRSGMITAAQNKKAEQIHQAQENKEEAIKLASSIRMAVDVAISLNSNANYSPEELKEVITNWRAWFYVNWNDIDTSETPPF